VNQGTAGCHTSINLEGPGPHGSLDGVERAKFPFNRSLYLRHLKGISGNGETRETPSLHSLAASPIPEYRANRSGQERVKTQEFLKKIDDAKVVSAIAQVERKTSGEIRFLISERGSTDPVTDAQAHFKKLGMEKTRERNAVLLFFAPVNQQYAVVGDSGIHEKCGPDFWAGVRDHMGDRLKSGQYTEAIVQAIQEIGKVLEKHFPRRPDDTNELPDDVIRHG
jgi:uncharacterized membrane protein